MLVNRWYHLLADSEIQPHGTGGRLGAQSRLASLMRMNARPACVRPSSACKFSQASGLIEILEKAVSSRQCLPEFTSTEIALERLTIPHTSTPAPVGPTASLAGAEVQGWLRRVGYDSVLRYPTCGTVGKRGIRAKSATPTHRIKQGAPSPSCGAV